MSKKQKRWIFYSSPVALLVVFLIGAKFQVNRIEERAQRLAETGKAAIALLNEYKAGVEAFDIDTTLECYDDAYQNENEGFWVQKLQSERDGVSVYEWQIEAPRPFNKSDQAEQLSNYFDTMQSIEKVKFVLDRIEDLTNAEKPIIRSVLWVIGTNDADEVFESQAHFRLWLTKAEEGFKIRKQELIRGVTVIGDQTGFTNVTQQVGIDFISNRNPIWATPEWEPKTFEIVKYASAGVTAADYDNDGWYDIFFADGKHPRLYHNNGDGTFTDATAALGLPTELTGLNVGIFADFDNDGDKDLFLGYISQENQLYRNNGDGTFTDVSKNAGLGGYFTTVAAADDYDNDGDLDLYIGRYLDPRTKLPTTLFFTRNGEGNILLRNDGNLRFTDVTDEAGVREGGLTLGVAWGDYDEDGDRDLYVANDFGRNTLFRNNSDGTFTDVSKETGTIDPGFGMSAAFGDIDNDGDLDIYISNVHSAQRWYAQAATLYQYMLNSIGQRTIFEDWPSYKGIFSIAGTDWSSFGDETVKGNSLMLNNGKGQFVDVSEVAGTNPFGWYWSSTMFDYDNDGRQDIYAVNGWITAKSEDDL